MRIAYVLESLGLCGGVKDVLEQANRLAARGHDVELLTRGAEALPWFDLRDVPRTACGAYGLGPRVRSYDGLAVATWWQTALLVAAREEGGAYFVQDVETSYTGDGWNESEILDTYRSGLAMFTESRWVAAELRRLGLPRPAYVGIGVDQDVFYPEPGVQSSKTVLFHERRHYLKGPTLRAAVLSRLKTDPDVHTVGYGPWGSNPLADDHLYFPTDVDLASYMRGAGCLLVTSQHEGFCMPAMEAMACGLPVVTTAADGNWYCEHEVNCLIGSDARELEAHVLRVLSDVALRSQLREGGLETVRRHFRWEPVIDRLEAVLEAVPRYDKSYHVTL